jgi:prepilin-type N-terminal cleavage/methylation domain-containing protein
VRHFRQQSGSRGAESALDNRREHCAGFTLIELLVVIAIIALLISILLPALGYARQTAKNTVDCSNIRQMAMAMTLYANDYKDVLPPGDAPSSGGTTLVWLYDPQSPNLVGTWDVLMNRYDVPARAFGCNSLDWIKDRWLDLGLYERHSRQTDYTKMGWNYYGNRAGTYFINPNLGGVTPYVFAKKLGDSRVTSDTLLTCANWNALLPGMDWRTVEPHNKVNRCKLWESGDPHPWDAPDGDHVARFDGSARFVRATDMKWLGAADWYYFEPKH